MKKNKIFGFTLIELIVVIAIIGVLAAILTPTFIGYVGKSKKLADKSAASSIGKAIMSISAAEEDVRDALFDSKSEVDVSVERSGTESYKLSMVCRTDSNKKWVALSSECQEVADALNDSDFFEGGSLAVKYHGAAKKTDCWIIGINKSSSSIEVWTGALSGSSASPSYRVWPDHDEVYQ